MTMDELSKPWLIRDWAGNRLRFTTCPIYPSASISTHQCHGGVPAAYFPGAAVHLMISPPQNKNSLI